MRAIIVVAIIATAAAADPARETAERYFRAGAKAYAAQSFAAAAADFDEAYKALPLPEIAFSAAQAYRRLYRVEPRPEHVRRAVELYRVYLDKVKIGGRVGDAADSLGELERELDKLKIRGAPVEAKPAVDRTRLGVDVLIAPPARSDARAQIAGQATTGALREIGDVAGESIKGLTATLDGKPVEPYALVDVTPGEHAIAVAADGYFAVAKKQHAVAGASTLVEIELAPKPATLEVRTEDGARIAVDGRAAPAAKLDLVAGTHLLAVTRSGREPFTKEVVVARGETVKLDAPLVPTGKRRAVPWVLGGAGLFAAGAATTATLAIVADGRASDLHAQIAAGDRPASDADAYDRRVRDRDNYRTATWLLGGAAVAAGCVGALLYYFDSPTTEGIRIMPTSGGLSASGRF